MKNFIGAAGLLSALQFLSLLKWTTESDYRFHPLDPLIPYEIQEAVDIIHATRPDIHGQDTWQFNWITLKEPEKSLLLPYFLDDSSSTTTHPPFTSKEFPRRALVILIETKSNTINEIVANLYRNVVESWVELPRGTLASYTVQENVDGIAIAQADAEVQERCREMGWVDMNLTVGETWSVGYAEDRPVLRNAIRPIQVYLFGKLSELDNHFAHPFDFLVTVDLALGKVIAIDNLPSHSDYDADNRQGNICPKSPANYNPALLPANFYRTDVHPIYFTQPYGAGYNIYGNEISWQKFKFRLGFNGREGHVIHHVSYQDGAKRRPLFYRMSVAELFVPYGDPRPPYYQKFPFDEGEFTLGYYAVDMKAARLCRGGVVAYMTFYLNDETGEPQPFPNCVCIFEEDAGILYAHFTEGEDEKVIHARSTRLTITSFYNLGNYDYKVSWRFYQDGTIEFNTELHGSLITNLLAKGVTDTGGFGTVVYPQINAQYHQHHLALRLDAEIDGDKNYVSMVDIVPVPEPSGSKENPYGQGFTTKEKILKNPSEARTKISPLTGRCWLIKNSERIHPYTKKPVAWKLAPYSAPLPFVRKDSPLHARCAYTDYNVWVTRYEEGQLYPAGFYLNKTGLPEWVKADPEVNLKDEDLVLWYIYGFTHLPRVEDFPLMPVESSGFFLRPTNFFLRNPGLDVPVSQEESGGNRNNGQRRYYY